MMTANTNVKAAPLNTNATKPATPAAPANVKAAKGANAKRTPAPVKGRRAANVDANAKGANATQTIKSLLAELAKATTTDEKKGIRRRLRSAGHYGGSRVKGLIVSREDAKRQLKAKA